jgi:hypothetical protein
MPRRVVAGALFLLATAGSGQVLVAQTLKSFTTTRQFHGEVHLAAQIDFAGGKLDVGAGAPASLYSMDLTYEADRFQPVNRWDAGRPAITLGLVSRDEGGMGVNAGTQGQVARVRFSPQADLDLSLNLGAAQSIVDLGGLRLSSLSVQTGASQTEVRFSRRNAMRCTAAAFSAGAAELSVRELGNSQCDRVTFTGGVGSVLLDYSGAWRGDATLEATLAVGGLTLRVPKTVGVTITTEQFLASFQPAGFTRQGNVYTSTNNATAAHHLDIKLTTSLGGVTVDWVD